MNKDAKETAFTIDYSNPQARDRAYAHAPFLGEPGCTQLRAAIVVLREQDARLNALDPSNRCAYRDTTAQCRCERANEFGGFCAAHDEEIHSAGGDNSPEGSAIIKRSALK